MKDAREPNTQAAEYVLGLLEGEANMEAERRLASDASFAREVEQWRARFGEFDDTTQSQPAGEALWNRIEATFADAPPRAAPLSAWSRLWSDISVLRTATIGASLAVLMLAVGLGVAIRQARLQPVMVAVLVDGDRTGAVVHAFADGRVVLLPLTSINVPSGRTLQVWTLPSRERGPVSVGLMDRARTLELELKDLPTPGPNQLFEITLEPAGGSPTGRPTGPILFKGNTAQTL
ncbi:MAG: anti-sigma factor [Tardiphaga sp.]|jgi:anti-sigma-K factor RskA